MTSPAARLLIRGDAGFRWRSGESVTRLEGFSDAVFGFAVTLLVLSLEVPKTFAELIGLFQGLPAFAASFALLILVWHSHCLFFRRYGLQDGLTTAINAVLLFVVLFYVYPLKFLFTLLADIALGLNEGAASTRPEDAVTLMSLYAAGLMAIFGLLLLLYANAYRLRSVLTLDVRERYLTVTSMQYLGIYCGVGLLALCIALVGGLYAVPWAGASFGLLGPFCGLHGWWRGRRMPDPDGATSPA